jgi:uncharacterized protein (DUF924 family)
MTAEDVLDFWFQGDPTVWRPCWFTRDRNFDAAIRARFADLLPAALAGQHDAWATTPEGALALVITLDQFPRNLHRATPRAFAADAKALTLATAAIAAGHDKALTPMQRVFLYLPFEHSESLADQDRSVALFESLGIANVTDYAHRHRDVILRFGRFPHRNAALGRASTPEELAYLAEPGAGF